MWRVIWCSRPPVARYAAIRGRIARANASFARLFGTMPRHAVEDGADGAEEPNIVDSALDDFKLQEDIDAAYVQASLRSGAWSLLAGVRADYDRVLKQRNALLKTARMARGRAIETLDVWDGHLTDLGGQLLAARLGLAADLAPQLAEAYARVAGDGALAAVGENLGPGRAVVG